MSMHPVDYVIIAVICCSSLGIGIYTSCTGGRQKTTKEYILGGRNMSLMPVAISILVSFWSAIALLGTPAEVFYYGSYILLTSVGIGMSCLLCAFTFVPLFYSLEITSIYEYLEMRYKNPVMRYLSTSLYVLTSILYLAVAQYAPALAMEGTMNLPVWISVCIMGAISVIYTAMGGIKAVIWSDAFQSFFIFVGLLAIIVKGSIDTGGISNVFKYSAEWNRLDFFNFSIDPTERITVWNSTFGLMVAWIAWYGANQASYQRFGSLPTLRKAKLSLLLNTGGIILLFGILGLAGHAVFGYYASIGCEPLTNGDIRNINQLLPYYVMTHLNIPSIPGIFIACILSGALSTTSTVLNSQAAVTVTDIIRPLKEISDEGATKLTKIFVLVYGILGTIVAYSATLITGFSLLQLTGSLLNCITGSTTGIYILAACVPKSTWKGALVGSIVSMALTLWISLGSLQTTIDNLPLPSSNCTNSSFSDMSLPVQAAQQADVFYLYRISFQWYGVIGALSCILVGLLVSIPNMVSSSAEECEEKYLFDFVKWIISCRKKQKFRRVTHEDDIVTKVKLQNEEDLELEEKISWDESHERH